MSEAAERLQAFLQKTPYVRFLGMGADLAGDDMTAALPFSPHLIGNTMIPAVHGGVLGAFLEMTAMAQLSVLQKLTRAPKTIDLTVEYLRPALSKTTYARAEVRKVGRRVANVQAEAWQETRASPVALLRCNFLLGPGEG